MVKDRCMDVMCKGPVVEHQFIQYLFTSVGNTEVTVAHEWDRKKASVVHRGREDRCETQEVHQFYGQWKRIVSVRRAMGSLRRVLSSGGNDLTEITEYMLSPLLKTQHDTRLIFVLGFLYTPLWVGVMSLFRSHQIPPRACSCHPHVYSMWEDDTHAPTWNV